MTAPRRAALWVFTVAAAVVHGLHGLLGLVVLLQATMLAFDGARCLRGRAPAPRA